MVYNTFKSLKKENIDLFKDDNIKTTLSFDKNKNSEKIESQISSSLSIIFSLAKSRTLVYVFAVISVGSFLIASGSDVPDLITLFKLFLATYCMALATYLYNDLTDFKVDTVNKREQVYDRKTHLYKVTRYSTIGFFLFSLTISFSIGLETIIASLVFIGLAIVYSHPRTRLKDRFIVKTTVTALGAFVASIMGLTAVDNLSYVALLSSVMAFLFYFILGPLGDVGDIEGDKKGGRRTFPIVIGIRGTFMVMYLAASCIGFIFFLAYYFFNLHFIGMILGFIICTIFSLQIHKISKNYQDNLKIRQARKSIRYSVFATFLAITVGEISKGLLIQV